MSDTPQHKDFTVSWEEILRDTKALAWRLSEGHSWKGIIAVARGGLVPASIMARELNLRVVETLCIASYDHQNQGEAQILNNIEGDGEGWLVIDDLADTGNTFRIVRETLPKAHLACVYAKPAGQGSVDTFVTQVSQDTWIHFPWEESHASYGDTKSEEA